MSGSLLARGVAWAAFALAGSMLFAAPATGPINRHFLSLDDIQKIRRNELTAGDSARVQIPNDVRRAYSAKRGVPFNEFIARPMIEQAADILDNGDEWMKSQVKVMSDPAAIVEFKKLQPMIIGGCASVGCHGGSNAGDFVLFPGDSDPATYTNFYILIKYSMKLSEPGGGFFAGPAEHHLAERGRGDMSILAQFALPASKATLHHPRVAGYNGIFRDPDDQRLRRLVDWMNLSLSRIEPDYHIDYKMPHAPTIAPTSQPATEPAAKPATRPAAAR